MIRYIPTRNRMIPGMPLMLRFHLLDYTVIPEMPFRDKDKVLRRKGHSQGVHQQWHRALTHQDSAGGFWNGVGTGLD